MLLVALWGELSGMFNPRFLLELPGAFWGVSCYIWGERFTFLQNFSTTTAAADPRTVKRVLRGLILRNERSAKSAGLIGCNSGRMDPLLHGLVGKLFLKCWGSLGNLGEH